MNPYQLKIKAKSLAAEAAIIRHAEARLKRFEKNIKLQQYRDKHRTERLDLQEHRKKAVREEARATHLARAFLSGKPYVVIEAKTYSVPPIQKAWGMVAKYGPAVSKHEQDKLWPSFKNWFEDGVHKQAA